MGVLLRLLAIVSSFDVFLLTFDFAECGVSDLREESLVPPLSRCGRRCPPGPGISLFSLDETPVTWTLAGRAFRTYEVLGRICTWEWVEDVMIELDMEDSGRDASTDRIPG